MTRRQQVVSIALTALSAMVVAAYLVLPGMWQWNRAEAKVEAKKPHQIEMMAGPTDPHLIARLRHASSGKGFGPVIITYHDIGHEPSPYTVTPEDFAMQMKMIHEAGWVTITSAQLADWMQGGAIPVNSVMITFDDGPTGVWKYAEPVLKRYDMHATAYLITGFIGGDKIWSPYYMTWEMVAELQATGRWDFGGHTHLGHVKIPSDDHGGQAPFLTAIQWLADKNRYETVEEQHVRVRDDLIACKHEFTVHGLPEPLFFAYPFSAHDTNPNAEDNWLQSTVLSMFYAGLLDDSDETRMTQITDLDRGFIRRMDITANVTPEVLVNKIESAANYVPAPPTEEYRP